MADKPKSMSQVKHVPKDAQVIMSIMKDMGITDYEPKVINQLLEFTYRYVTCILDDSRIYANHAKKKFIDLDDVRLAVKMQLERSFTNPPPRDVLLDVAKAKNNIPLPFVKPNNGLRLPPDRYCLNSTNYKLKNATKKIVTKPLHAIVGNSFSGGQTRLKMEPNKTGLSIVKRPGTLATVARTQTISIPKPVFKFSTDLWKNPQTPCPVLNVSLQHPYRKEVFTYNEDSLIDNYSSTIIGSAGNAAVKSAVGKPKIQISGQPVPVIKMETDESAKRKRDEEDYDIA